MPGGLRTQSAPRQTVRVRQVLVSVEVGATVVLLLAAGLLLQSAARLIRVDPGFETDNVITFQVGMPANRYPDPAARVQVHRSGRRAAGAGAGGERGRVRRVRADDVDARDPALCD